MPLIDLLRDLVLLFALGAVAVLVFDRLRLPPLVGYLITGVIIGPFGLGLIDAVAQVQSLAEVGVVLLLFTIGLQFSIRDLARLGRTVVIGGGLQVGVTILLVAALALLAGQGAAQAVFFGMLVAHSSSTLVLRLLSHRGESDSLHARSALGVSLFQDLSIVPMVLAVPMLAGQGQSAAAVVVTVLEALLFVGGSLLAARILVPSMLALVVATRQREAFLLTVMVLCLGAAWAAAAAGLSLALGAFIAGLIISESEYSHQALSEVLPLREIFIGLFFISVGMLLDLQTVISRPVAVALVLASVIALKLVVATGALLAVGHTLRTALLAGTALAQIGEFGFVLGAAGQPVGLLDAEWMQLFLTAAVGSMTLMPLLLTVIPRVVPAVQRVLPTRFAGESMPGAMPPAEAGAPPADHVIIVGFGQNGRNLARVLERNHIGFVIIEMNPEVVRAEREHGRRLIYGDATRPGTLNGGGIEQARVLVVAISDAAATRGVVVAARMLNPRLHILVRTRYVAEIEELQALGTDEVIAEEFETSIEIFSRVLQWFLVPRDIVERNIQDVRQDAYEMLRTMGDARIPAEDVSAFAPGIALEVVRVASGSEIAGRRLAESGLRERFGVTVVALRRPEGEILVKLDRDQVLEAGCAALLLGRHEQLPLAAEVFANPATSASSEGVDARK